MSCQQWLKQTITHVHWIVNNKCCIFHSYIYIYIYGLPRLTGKRGSRCLCKRTTQNTPLFSGASLFPPLVLGQMCRLFQNVIDINLIVHAITVHLKVDVNLQRAEVGVDWGVGAVMSILTQQQCSAFTGGKYVLLNAWQKTVALYQGLHETPNNTHS